MGGWVVDYFMMHSLTSSGISPSAKTWWMFDARISNNSRTVIIQHLNVTMTEFLAIAEGDL